MGGVFDGFTKLMFRIAIWTLISYGIAYVFSKITGDKNISIFTVLFLGIVMGLSSYNDSKNRE